MRPLTPSVRLLLRVLALIGAGVLSAAAAAPASAEVSPDGRVFRPITFPVDGKVSYYDDFGA